MYTILKIVVFTPQVCVIKPTVLKVTLATEEKYVKYNLLFINIHYFFFKVKSHC